MHEFEPKGTCSTKIIFALDPVERRVHSVSFEDGCNGNLKALGTLVEGMNCEELVAKLRGIQCEDRGTSCADQLARAVFLTFS